MRSDYPDYLLVIACVLLMVGYAITAICHMPKRPGKPAGPEARPTEQPLESTSANVANSWTGNREGGCETHDSPLHSETAPPTVKVIPVTGIGEPLVGGDTNGRLGGSGVAPDFAI